MTVNEAIAQFDALVPNSRTTAEKIAWLSECDGMMFDRLLDFYIETEGSFSGYSSGDGGTELLIKPPYDGLYICYLQFKNDYFNEEFDRANNSLSQFIKTVSDCRNSVNRNNTHKSRRMRYL